MSGSLQNPSPNDFFPGLQSGKGLCFNLQLAQNRSDFRIAQRPNFDFPLPEIRTVQVFGKSRMASQLGHADRQRVENFLQALRTDGTGKRFAFAGLAVKSAAIANTGITLAQRDGKPPRQFQHDGTHRFLPMRVLVRVEVRRVPARQFTKRGELPVHFGFHGVRVAGRNNFIYLDPPAVLINQFAEVEMQPEAYVPFVLRKQRRRRRRAGAPSGWRWSRCPLVRADDAAIHARAEAEVIGVDDQMAFG